MFKNLFEKKIKESSFDEEQIKIDKAEKARINDRIDIDDLSPDELDKVNKLEEVVTLLFDDKQELRSVYNHIKDYLPKSNQKISPEMLWENLRQKYDDKGQPTLRSDEEIVELIANKADQIIKEKINTDESGLNGVVKNKLYEVEMSNAYANFLHFQSLAESIKDRDNYYERIEQYKNAKTAEEKEKIWNDLPGELKEIARYKNFVLREFLSAKKKSNNLKNNIKAYEFLIDKYQSEGAPSDLIKSVYDNMKQTLNDYEDLLLSSPELYYYECSSRLQEAKNVIDANGSIIETPYVKAKLALIASFGNRPVFIHGELGSGKTELAKFACRTKYSKEYVENVWEKKNPKPSDPDELADWQIARRQESEALIISGHKNIDVSEFFGSKEMKIKEVIPVEKLADLIEKTVQRVKQERKDMGTDLSKSEEKDIRDISKESFKNPVEIKTIIGLFYQAMKDGRPIILDEINAIPHTALIALNDLLILKPGSVVKPLTAGIPKFQVAKGFRVFATGNWKPEDGKAYFGRQGLDAAFLSRFSILSYDYLPQRIIGTTETSDTAASQEEHAKSELLDIMVSSLLDKNLSLNIPQGSFKKLSALASASRVIQNIFSEKAEGDVEFDWRSANKKIKQKDILKENVLSIRHLIPIIQNWKKDGFRFELEEYILKDYIERSQTSRNSEKLLIYRLMQNTHGGILFNEKDGWPNSSGVKGEEEVVKLTSDKRLFNFNKSTGQLSSKVISNTSIKMEHFSTRKVIEHLFGRFPDRKFLNRRIFKAGEKESNFDLDILRENERVENLLKESFQKFQKVDFVKNEDDAEIIKQIKIVSEGEEDDNDNQEE